MPFEVLIPEAEIARRVRELGERISEDYQGRAPVIIGVLTGAFLFMADLIRHLSIPFVCDFIKVASYHGDQAGPLTLHADLSVDIRDRDILLIEDILDSGATLDYLTRHLSRKSPKTLKICCLLDKGHPCTIRGQVAYTGFKIPDEFVVGYGLDINGSYRNLPNLCIFRTNSE